MHLQAAFDLKAARASEAAEIEHDITPLAA